VNDKQNVRLLKLNNGEELVGLTDGKVKDGLIRLDKIIRIIMIPPSREGEQPKIAFADYVPWVYTVGSSTKTEDRKAKYFYERELLHPPMEVQDQLEKEYRSLWSGLALPEGSNLILPS